jgi:hypothetical protein
MRITLLGHASLLIEGRDKNVIMDPVFSDPFQDGLVVSCPRREVNRKALPPMDAIVLSHDHADHLHLPSLRSLPKDLPFYIPAVESLKKTVALEGFTNIHMVLPGEVIEVGRMRLFPTASRSGWHEMGMAFSEGACTVWNMVDTVVDAEICNEVLGFGQGSLELAFCAYRPLLEFGGMWVSEDDFPRQRFERLLEMAICSRAKVVVPGSAGLRAADHSAWANHRIFPVTREEFVQALAEVAPEVKSLILNPGQAVIPNPKGRPRVEKTPYAQVVENDEWRVAFAPEENPAPPLEDKNAWAFAVAELKDALTPIVEVDLPARMQAELDGLTTSPLRRLCDRRASVQVEVAFPDKVQAWHVKAWAPQVQLARGPHPDPDYVFGYVASEILAYLMDEGGMPSCQARRNRKEPENGVANGAPFRFSTLEPARLNSQDPHLVVDDMFEWNLLGILDE